MSVRALFGARDTEHGFEQASPFARGATAWLHELVGAKDEVASLAPRRDHFNVMTTRARGTKGMLQIGLNVAARRSKRSRQRRNRAWFMRQQFQQMSSKRHASLSCLAYHSLGLLPAAFLIEVGNQVVESRIQSSCE